MRDLGRNRQAPPAETLDLRSLFETYYASIWRLLDRLGVPSSDLDDAAQEVFWVAARRLRDIRPGSEHPFLYGVALRVASDIRRKMNTISPVALVDATKASTEMRDPEAVAQTRQAREMLCRVLDEMPEELRGVFVLFELEDVEIKQIAQLHSIPVGTASSRLRRARQVFSAICKRLNTSRQRSEL